MSKYLGEFPVNFETSPFARFTPADWALHYIEQYGGIDGAHHKQWLLNQIARILNGCSVNVVEARWADGTKEYRHNVSSNAAHARWITQMKDGEDGPETYDWDEGLAP